METIADNTIAQQQQDSAAPKRLFPLQSGATLMRDQDVLATSKSSLDSLANVIRSDPTKAFDAVYANIPWSTVSMDYLMSLPVRDLFRTEDSNGLFMWVDSGYVDKAVDLLRAWGFQFHSHIHTLTSEKPIPKAAPSSSGEQSEDGSTTTNATPEISEEASEEVAVETAVDETSVVSTVAAPPRAAPRKQIHPPGWVTDGLVSSKTRMLWFAVKAGSDATVDYQRYLKDPSFIRKRLSHTSSFCYAEENDPSVTTLSAKKKNFEHWKIFPEYDVYTPASLTSTIELFFKSSAKVLSLFNNGLSKTWYAAGPNVPGYFSGPLRTDGGFPLLSVLFKYFTSIKNATVLKHLTLLNVYAVQFAKKLHADANQEEFVIPPIVETRLHEFIGELLLRVETSGGVRESTLAAGTPLRLFSPTDFAGLDNTLKAQFLLMIGNVIRHVQQRNAETAERRKKSASTSSGSASASKKRKSASPADGEPPRKYGIAAPVTISEDLAKFMGVPPNEKVARTSVVKFINQYIANNNLQNPKKKTEILPDEKLQDLLNPDPGFRVTYFNLCKLIGKHFDTSAAAAAAAAAAGGSATVAMDQAEPISA